jgi:hemerythrin
MFTFDWKDEYSIGFPSIDSQHKKLFSLINEILEGMRAARELKDIQGILDELAQYAIYHFSQEEILFQEYGYRKSKEHGVAHEFFMKKLEILKAYTVNNDKEASEQSAAFLVRWLGSHILQDDMDYRDAIGNSGATHARAIK